MSSARGPIVVKKFGGSSVADVGRIRAIAEHLVAAQKSGERVVVVVSAMGKTTDQLVQLAQEAANQPDRREMDMLLTAGERITMALLAMAIRDLGVAATSLTGSQSGILTDDHQGAARIVEVRPYRVEDALREGHIVIVAGFQGVSYRREVTTLGRGGSDTTAVALAAALGAKHCDIYTDIDGVYTADPKTHVTAERLLEIDHSAMLDLAQAGARVLSADAIAYAQAQGIALYVRASDGRPGETLVRVHPPAHPPATWGVAVRVEAAVIRGTSSEVERLATWLERCPQAVVLATRPGRDSGDFAQFWIARPVGDKSGAAHRAWLQAVCSEVGADAQIERGALLSAVLPGVPSKHQWRVFAESVAPYGVGPTACAQNVCMALVRSQDAQAAIDTVLGALESA